MTTLMHRMALAAAVMFLAGCATMGSAPLGTGDWVVARWTDEDPYWYPAIVATRQGDELALHYDDGTDGVQPARNVRRFGWRAGSRVECRWQGGSWYRGRIAEMAPDRYNINVRYDDGDSEATNTSMCREP